MSRWSESEDAVLRAEWTKGTPLKVIVPMLPQRGRNSVIGRVHTLGLAKRQGLSAPRRTKAKVLTERVYTGDSWSARLFEPWSERKARLARERARA